MTTTYSKPYLRPRQKSEPWTITERAKGPDGTVYVRYHAFATEGQARAFRPGCRDADPDRLT